MKGIKLTSSADEIKMDRLDWSFVAAVAVDLVDPSIDLALRYVGAVRRERGFVAVSLRPGLVLPCLLKR